MTKKSDPESSAQAEATVPGTNVAERLSRGLNENAAQAVRFADLIRRLRQESTAPRTAAGPASVDIVFRNGDETTFIEVKTATPADSDYSGWYLFISLDLVGSTKFKSEEPIVWPDVIEDFYGQVNKLFGHDSTSYDTVNSSGYQIWKYVGDEVLYYKLVNSVADLKESIDKFWSAFDAAVDIVERPDFIDKHKAKRMPSVDAVFQPSKSRLSVKGTAWIAHVKTPDKRKPTDSIRIATLLQGAPMALDFLGPDIDAGFRVSRFTAQRVVTLSADLAYLLAKHCAELAAHIRQVGFEVLKGVWGDRHYPIYWYHGDWDRYRVRLAYDEQLKYPMIEVALNAKPLTLDQVRSVLSDPDHKARLEVLEGFNDPEAQGDLFKSRRARASAASQPAAKAPDPDDPAEQ